MHGFDAWSPACLTAPWARAAEPEGVSVKRYRQTDHTDRSLSKSCFEIARTDSLARLTGLLSIKASRPPEESSGASGRLLTPYFLHGISNYYVVLLKTSQSVTHATHVGMVQAWVVQNVTFSRPPSGEWLARTRMRSDGDDLGGKGRANSPP